MTDDPKRHVIPEPFPETIGVSSMTIWAPADFRGDVEIIWWYPGKSADSDRQRMTCSCAWLLQGVFHDVRGSRPREDLLGPKAAASFDARIVAHVLHTFYRVRIEAAARLEAAYQWQSYPLEWRR
jgi:hypothetical protein